MAQIDVSEALTDPDYVDETTYLRTRISTDPHGVATGSAQSYPLIGSIQAGDGDKLNRGGDSEYQTGTIMVLTKEPLTAGNNDFTADIVLWRGVGYTVTRVADWGNYGEGYIRAECELKPLAGAAPGL